MTLRQRLAARDPLLGTFLKTPHPHVVEVLATCGLDLLCIDAEHAPFDRAAIDLCILAARSAGLPVLVRPQSGSAEQILNALDCGADGVLVPHVRSAEEAEAVARACRYMPGGRGYAGSSRAAGYGLRSMAEHRAASNESVVVIAQIEDREALDAIDAIAAVPDIDALFIGRADLTVALDCASPDDAPVVAAVERVVAACAAHGHPCGMFLPRATDAAHWREKGASLFLLGSDHGFLRTGAAALRQSAGF
jgi:2-keto-3-deoxy-L-rhamnonate aldolase RhmA